jgi:uncharacterized protein (TIGR00255 family)
MTAYARTEGVLEKRRCVVEIRTVNHRFCDINLKLPKALSALELPTKKHVGSRIVRGRVDMTVQWENGGEGEFRLRLNADVAQELYALLTTLKEQLQLEEEVSLAHLLALRDVVISVEKAEEACDNLAGLEVLVDEALDELVAMREAEGSELKKDLASRAQTLVSIAGEVEGSSSRLPESIREKLTSRFRQMELSGEIDENRLLSEIFLLAERADITEEIVRTRSHLQQFESLLKADGAIGRKLDFIIQELNRELNTIASKANDATISQAVVEAKSELEKMREQVQNVE